MPKPIIAITLGDPGGIGPEVIVKALKDFKISEGFYYLLIGIPEPFEFLKGKFQWSLPLHPVSTLEPSLLRKDAINFLTTAPGEKTGFDRGKVSFANASAAFAALKIAATHAAAGLIGAIVTAPINKTAMRLIDPRFHGHTEYLAKISKTKEFAMMFVSERLKVTLVTIHVPIRKISRLIKQKDVLEKIRLTNDFLKKKIRIARPKIAVCALNPHGRETGEEDEIEIAPAVQQARQEKIEASGPLSADQLFHDAYEGRFDAVVSMYHDQGLAPFKMIAFRDGVNVTLGLPFIRTSPDHGTAFDIAYQGKANPASMQAALNLARQLVVPI